MRRIYGMSGDALESSAPFDAFEIAACIDLAAVTGYTGDAGTVHRTADFDPEELDGLDGEVFWSLFGHRDDEGVWSIADFPTYEAARRMAEALIATTTTRIVDA
jgi:hypothetical protein